MRPTRFLLNAAKPRPKVPVPVEMYPLFAAMGVAIASLLYFTYRHLRYDQQLRLLKNPNLSKLDDVLNEHAAKEAAAEALSSKDEE